MKTGYWLIHIPKTGGTSLRVFGIPGEHKEGYKPDRKNIILIRNPIDRTLSHFKEESLGKDIKLSNWFVPNFFDYQVGYLKRYLGLNSLDEIKRFILEHEVIVIPTDRLTEGMKRMGFKVGHLNKSTRNYNPSNEEIELIKLHTKQDMNLYNWVCSLF